MPICPSLGLNAESRRTAAPQHVVPNRIIAASLSGFQYDVAPDGRFLIKCSQLVHLPSPYSLAGLQS